MLIKNCPFGAALLRPSAMHARVQIDDSFDLCMLCSGHKLGSDNSVLKWGRFVSQPSHIFSITAVVHLNTSLYLTDYCLCPENIMIPTPSPSKAPGATSFERYSNSHDDSNFEGKRMNSDPLMSHSAQNLLDTNRRPDNNQTITSQNAHKFAFQRALQEKEINRLVSKLPYKVREGVNSVVNMTLSQTENIHKDLEVSKLEAMTLRFELIKKNDEIHTLKKSCDLYQEKARYLEENVATLKDNIDSKQKFTIKNRTAISKLASTNRLLIDSLDALQAKSTLAIQKPKNTYDFDQEKFTNVDTMTPINNTTNTALPSHKQRSNLLLPISNNNAPVNNNMNAKQQQSNLNQTAYEETEKKYSMFQNDKLRESLLRVAREHYKAQKNGEILEQKVGELRISLKAQEQQNRLAKFCLFDFLACCLDAFMHFFICHFNCVCFGLSQHYMNQQYCFSVISLTFFMSSQKTQE